MNRETASSPQPSLLGETAQQRRPHVGTGGSSCAHPQRPAHHRFVPCFPTRPPAAGPSIITRAAIPKTRFLPSVHLHSRESLLAHPCPEFQVRGKWKLMGSLAMKHPWGPLKSSMALCLCVQKAIHGRRLVGGTCAALNLAASPLSCVSPTCKRLRSICMEGNGLLPPLQRLGTSNGPCDISGSLAAGKLEDVF